MSKKNPDKAKRTRDIPEIPEGEVFVHSTAPEAIFVGRRFGLDPRVPHAVRGLILAFLVSNATDLMACRGSMTEDEVMEAAELLKKLGYISGAGELRV